MNIKKIFSRIIYTVLVSWPLAACSDAGNFDQHTATDTSSSASPFSGYGDSFKLASNFTQPGGSYDLNNDGKSDAIYFVEFAADVKIGQEGFVFISPWPLYEEASEEGRPSHSRVAIAIEHGDTDSRFIIYDQNQISTLDTLAAREAGIVYREDLSGSDLLELVELAKGDIIVLPTEAGIDTYIYWDGDTYTLHEPLDIP